ncbi:hypothetical protein ACQPTN_32545 [Bradyrhizobium sp. 13971]
MRDDAKSALSVDPAVTEITTLGQGGSDTAAVAMAAALKAERCEIIKVVDEHLLGRSAYRTGCKAIAASGTKCLPGIIGEAEAVG